MHAYASAHFFKGLPQHVRTKIVRLLRELDRLELSCRCEIVEGRDLHVVVGYGLARAKFWLDLYDVTDESYPLT